MTRPVKWLLTKAGMKVCCELSDVEYQAMSQATLVGLLASGVVVTRLVPVPLDEFAEIGDLRDVPARCGRRPVVSLLTPAQLALLEEASIK